MTGAKRWMGAMLAAASLSGCTKPEPGNVDYLANAQRLYAEDKLKAAHIELKNALRQDPNDAQARLLLGRLYLDSAMPDAAETELLRAQSEGISAEATEPLMARALLEQGRFSELLSSPPMKSLSPPTQAELLSIHALAQLGLGRWDEAEQTVERALEIFPTSVSALAAKARLAAVREDLAAARELVARVHRVDPDHAEAWSLLGDIEQNAGNPEAAETAFSNAVDNRLYNARDLIKRTLVRIELGRIEEAGKDIEDLQRRFPGNAEISFLQARLALARGEVESARELLARAVEYRPRHAPTLFYLGAANFALGNLEEARTRLRVYLDQVPDSAAARKLLARIVLQEGGLGEAERLLRPVVEASPDDAEARTLLGSVLAAQGVLDEARGHLQRAAELQPESATALQRLAGIELALGEATSARNRLARAIELDPEDEQSYMLLGRVALAGGNAGDLAEVARQLQASDPESATALNMIGSARLAEGDVAAAKEAFLRAAGIRPGHAFALHSLASLALQEGNPEKARRHYETVLAHDPDHLPTLLRIAGLEASLGDDAGAVRTLERATQAHPDRLEPYVELSSHYLARNEPKRAQGVLIGAQERFGSHSDWLTAFGRAQLASDPEGAVGTLSRAVERAPRSVTAHYLLALAYGQTGREREHAEQLSKVLKLDPDHAPARLAEARMALRNGNPTRADAALARLRAGGADASDPELTLLEGRIAAALGQSDRAEAAFRRAFEQAPATRTLLALSQQLWDQGAKTQSMALLGDWVEAHPEDTAAMVGLANAYLRLEREDEALGMYRRVLEIDPANLTALNNAAWLLRRSDAQGALRYAAKARAIAPDSPEVMDTIGVVAMEAGDYGLAERMLKRALEQGGESPGVRWHYAQLLERSGKPAEARELLTELLGRPVEFPGRADAEALLSRLDGR